METAVEPCAIVGIKAAVVRQAATRQNCFVEVSVSRFQQLGWFGTA
jgi:hypothetical protein